MSSNQPEICFFIGKMKFIVDDKGNLRQANGANGMVFGRLIGFSNPENDQEISPRPVVGWRVIIANQSGKEFTFDQVVTVVINRRGLKIDRREFSRCDEDRRKQIQPE